MDEIAGDTFVAEKLKLTEVFLNSVFLCDILCESLCYNCLFFNTEDHGAKTQRGTEFFALFISLLQLSPFKSLNHLSGDAYIFRMIG